MLSIGFDAKRLYWNFTGLGNYSRTLLRTLAEVRPEWHYHLFTPRINEMPRLDFLKKIPHLSVHAPAGAWSALPAAWRSWGMSGDIRRSGVGIYHGLSHELPAGLTDKKIKKVVTIHDLIFERYPEQYPFLDRQVYHYKFRQACQAADVVVAISEQTKADIIDYYKIDPQRIQVIYQSCEPIFLQPADVVRQAVVRQKYGLPRDFLLYVGSVIERKNLLGVVKALQQIKDYPDLPLVIVGDGRGYRQQVEAYITAHGLQSRIFWYKSLDFADLPFFYQQARTLVLPSLFEGFGIPIIESLNCGTPVVTSRDSCFRETAGSGALYVDPLDPGAIAAAIRRLLEDSVLHRELALAGKQYVRRFDASVIGSEWVKLYESMT